ncbi:MAG: 4Fe-4S dicluster domain-containing protein [Dehalococcoidia bacterium]|nr:4Fe-4S dicluster domain-containing protein [Dehalococcoidia bacterium]
MAIVLNELDSKFKYEVAEEPGGENLKRCFACGICTASCPVSDIDSEYNPRKIIHMVLLGMKKEVLSSNLLWLCTQCYTCQEHCPQNVKFSDVVKALRNMAVREGYVHPSFAERVREIDVFSQKLRHRMVLSVVDKKAEEIKVDLAKLAEEAVGKEKVEI